jgi:hypothetical protein
MKSRTLRTSSRWRARRTLRPASRSAVATLSLAHSRSAARSRRLSERCTERAKRSKASPASRASILGIGVIRRQPGRIGPDLGGPGLRRQRAGALALGQLHRDLGEAAEHLDPLQREAAAVDLDVEGFGVLCMEQIMNKRDGYRNEHCVNSPSAIVILGLDARIQGAIEIRSGRTWMPPLDLIRGQAVA